MNNYCTLFDSFYLTRALAMYQSIESCGENFHLYAYCFDEKAYEILKKLALPNLTALALSSFETPELLKVKPTRSRGEYCWTNTPHIILHAIETFGLNEVTYLDADLYFFKKPSILLDEFNESKANVLITEHRYSPEYDQSALSGVYCVQFMTFKATEQGLYTLRWWKERCLEWCYARNEDGKFGDQKYLDDWLTRFKGVHVLQHPGGGVAPWNVGQYQVGTGPCINNTDVVFYHYHSLKWLTSGHFVLTENYTLPKQAIEFIYKPYLEALKQAQTQVETVSPGFSAGKIKAPAGVKAKLRRWKKMWEGTYFELAR